MRATPSSVAFCTMKSMRSARAMHCTSVTASGDSRSTVRASPTATATREPRTLSTLGGEFAAVAGEQHQLVAAAHAQHLGQMDARRGRQLEAELPALKAAST